MTMFIKQQIQGVTMKKFTETGMQINMGTVNCSECSTDMNFKLERPSVLLHSCCGPCSTAVIERLLSDYNITVFFYNPNITEKEEYELRLDAQRTVVDRFNGGSMFIIDRIGLIEGTYRPDSFLCSVRGLEDEPEGGERCSVCFRLRLEETARRAKAGGYDFFATTLTVSPHKNYTLISQIGKEIADDYGIGFLDMDFKKKAGFQRSIELSKKFGLYRQNYCGCRFSRWFDKPDSEDKL